jgi:hypothetical protein
MKKLFFVTLILVAVLACDKKPGNPVADSMLDSYQKGKQAGETGNLDSVRKAVQAYHATSDKYPKDLDEIKSQLNSEVDLSNYDYDPESGVVTIKAE